MVARETAECLKMAIGYSNCEFSFDLSQYVSFLILCITQYDTKVSTRGVQVDTAL